MRTYKDPHVAESIVFVLCAASSAATAEARRDKLARYVYGNPVLADLEDHFQF